MICKQTALSLQDVHGCKLTAPNKVVLRSLPRSKGAQWSDSMTQALPCGRRVRPHTQVPFNVRTSTIVYG